MSFPFSEGSAKQMSGDRVGRSAAPACQRQRDGVTGGAGGNIGSQSLSSAKKQSRAKSSYYKRNFIPRGTEVVQASQLGRVGSGEKLQEQKGPGSSGEGRAEVTHLVGGASREEGEEGPAGTLLGESKLGPSS